MNRKVSLFIALVVCSTHLLWGQVTDGFSYQAVARDNTGNVLKNTVINMRFTIKEGTPGGTNVYSETHAPTTNEFGLVNLLIGDGSVASGDFETIDWGANPYFLIVELNGAPVDTSQFQAVPYAKYATDMATTDLSDISGSPANGQVLKWNGTEWAPADDDNTDDADADPTNELQTLSKSGNTVTLSNSGGNFTDEVDDADADPTNEIQTLSLSGSTLSLSNGGGNVNIAASPWVTTGSDIYYNTGNVGVGVTNPLTNFHVGFSDDVLFGGTLTSTGAKLFYDSNDGGLIGGRIGNYNPKDSIDRYSIAWGFETVATGDYAAAFNSQSRAYGNLSLAAGFRTYSDTYLQTTVGRYNARSNGSGSLWVGSDPLFVVGNGANISNRNNAFTIQKDGRIGFNEANPLYFLDMENDDISTRSIYIDHNATLSSSTTQYGVYVDLDKTSASSTSAAYGVYITHLNEGGTSYGMFATSNTDATGSQAAYGVRALADNDGGTGVAYAIYASASASGSTSSGVAYGGYFSGSVYTTGSYLPSDASLKSELRPASSVLGKVLDLQIANYTYNHAAYPHMELPAGQRTGFVADNVATLMPELVKQTTHPATTDEEIEEGWPAGDDVHFQAVDYAGMTPYLVKAIQEQQNIIEAQQAQIDALRHEVELLKQQN